MRPIKFRAWDNKCKKWLLGYELKNLGGFSLIGESVLLGEWSSVLREFLFDRNGHKAEDLVVMQFTGLKDKNGKEIYEGDIIRWAGMRKEGISKIAYQYEIIYKDGCFGYYIGQGFQRDLNEIIEPPRNFEIIGNVYENPTLLK